VPIDVLSDVLRAVHLTGSVYFDFELSSPWALEAPPSREIVDKVMPGAQRLIEYHLIARGGAWGNAIGGEPIRLEEGDVLIFPQGDGHVLSHAPGMRAAVPAYETTRALPIVSQFGGGREPRTRIVCCFLGLDERPFNPLFAALPPVIHVSASDRHPSGGWLESLLHVAAREATASRAGSENVLSRISELIFVEVVRRHVETLPPSETGWLAGLRDATVGRALTALHADPVADWTVERLARAAGASRSVLAERFTELVGQPPMQYLALWRMQLASRRLLDGEGVAAVAAAVGYESEAAFSRAFKKLVGTSPARWRRDADARRR